MLRSNPKVVRRMRGRRVCLIPQDPELTLHPLMRIRDHIQELLRAHFRMSKLERREKTQSTLALCGLSASIAHAYPHQLSGGQRQRCVIAMALACEPSLLIADEPTSALDSVTQLEIISVLERLVRQMNLALIFITHNPLLARRLAHRVLVMRHGAVVEDGNLQQVLASPRHPYTAKLLASVLPLPPPAENTPNTSAARTPEKLLEVRGLTKTYPIAHSGFKPGPRRAAVTQVDLALPSGFTTALVGKSGSGKSTLARCMALLEQPDHGQLWIFGQPVPKKRTRELRRLRSKIQLVWQHSALALNPRWRNVDVVAEPLRIQHSLPRRQSRQIAFNMMAQVGLDSSLSLRTPLELSGGQRQRLALARALIIHPSVLILDEVFAGLDLPLQAEIAKLLVDLKNSSALSCLLLTHDLRRAASLADLIYVMDNGRIVESGEPAALFSKPNHQATRALVEAIVTM